MKLIDLSIDD